MCGYLDVHLIWPACSCAIGVLCSEANMKLYFTNHELVYNLKLGTTFTLKKKLLDVLQSKVEYLTLQSPVVSITKRLSQKSECFLVINYRIAWTNVIFCVTK